MISRFRIGRLIFALLALAVLGASIEAKLSMYHARHSRAASTWQVIKLREFQIVQATAPVEVPPADTAPLIEPDPQPAIPDIPVRAKPGSGPSVPQFHWLRPPPSIG